MEISERIKLLRAQKELTLEQVGDYVGVSKATVLKWENGAIQNMRRDKIVKLASVLGVTPEYLLGWETERRPATVRVPVYGRVAAGIPMEAITDIEDYEEIDAALAANGEYIALRIHGHSMEPRFTEGDVVIVRKQPDIEDGQIGVVLVNGDDATVKRVKRTREGILLMPTNPAYEPIFYSNKQIRELPVKILGKVVELRAKF